MSMMAKPCPHCGTMGQIYLEWDKRWECTCYKCGCIFPIPDTEIPPEIQRSKNKYSVNVLQSSSVFQGSGRPKFNNREE
jgi:transcription initiation factor TFIIIB Brf1 subunit/transcription initiation factor TFIIB